MRSWHDVPELIILGHRGARAVAPENTIRGFEVALEQGAVGVEFDVQLSSDGTPMVIHDHTVDRTTNGSGHVQQLTASELQQFDAGAGTTIPTLEAVLAHFGNSILYNIEIKDMSLRDQGTETAVAALVAQYDLAAQVLVSSFNPLALRRIEPHISTQTKLGYIHMRPQPRLWRRLATVQADHPHFSSVNEAYMEWAQRMEQRVHVWTVNEPAEARRLQILGVHGLICDHPSLIIDALEKTS